MGGTNSTGIEVDIDFLVHTDCEAHTDGDTSFDTDWVGNAQDYRMLALVQPEVSHHSSSSRCRTYFPSRSCILCNISLHALMTYKIYRKFFLGHLQLFVSIDTLRRGAL